MWIEPIPAGEYSVKIVESYVLTDEHGYTRACFGYVVNDGDFAGARFESRHLIAVPVGAPLDARRAEYIGHHTLADLTFACGLDAALDTEDLHNRLHRVRLSVLEARPARPAGERDNLGRFLPAQSGVKESRNEVREWLNKHGERRGANHSNEETPPWQ